MSLALQSAPADAPATYLPQTQRLERKLSRSERRVERLERKLNKKNRIVRRLHKRLVTITLAPPTSRGALPIVPPPTPVEPAGGGTNTSIRDGLLCIHSHEGSWTANTGNGYHGGLQMDRSFEEAYGAEFVAAYGDAENWPVEDQLIAGERGYDARGWSPWPNTARMCGLL